MALFVYENDAMPHQFLHVLAANFLLTYANTCWERRKKAKIGQQ